MFERLMQYLRREDGATAVEYGLMVALIAAIIVVVVAALGNDVLAGFEAVENTIGGSQAAGTGNTLP